MGIQQEKAYCTMEQRQHGGMTHSDQNTPVSATI